MEDINLINNLQVCSLDDEEKIENDQSLALITIVSKDGGKFKINKKTLHMSKFLRTLLYCENNKEIILPNISSVILSKIILYLEYHVDNPVPEGNCPLKLISNLFCDNIKCAWDVDFIENNIMKISDTIYNPLNELVNAANYMEIEDLLQLSCMKVLCILKEKHMVS